jgi:hypothetical protein
VDSKRADNPGMRSGTQAAVWVSRIEEIVKRKN